MAAGAGHSGGAAVTTGQEPSATSPTNGAKYALLVGCAKYKIPMFKSLPARANIDALAKVLRDPYIGEFEVTELLNQKSGVTSEQIESFFANRRTNDLLLLYFSCHGILDSAGQLFFATADTKRELPDTTGISARRVKTWMDQSRSQRIILLLDCCHGGAFDRGLTRGDSGAKKVIEQLVGRGRVVIAASDKLEPAYDSEFTDAVVRGLRTGDADLDGNGWISVWEFYEYIHTQVQQNRPGQTPTMSADGIRGQLNLAKNPHPAMPLPDELTQALRSGIPWVRSGAVDGLRRMLRSNTPGGQKRTARQELSRLAGTDPDGDIQEEAHKALGSPSPLPTTAGTRHSHSRRWLAIPVLALIVVAGVVLRTVLPPASPSAPPPTPCTPSVKPADGVLSLGTLLPKTGAFNYSGPAPEAGVRLAMKDINEAGGIPRVAVEFDAGNQRDEGNPSSNHAVQSANALLAGGVDVIIGPETSPAARKIIDKITCAGVIMFAPANTSTIFTTYNDHGFYFRTSPSSEFEGQALGGLVTEDHNSTTVILSRDDEFGNPLRKATEETIRKSGGRILDSFSYNPNALDYDKEIQRIKAKDPDAIVLIGFTEISQILVKMIEEGLGPRNKHVYGSGATMTNTLAGQVSPQDPGALKGLRGTPLYAGDESFIKRLREANPAILDLTYAAQGYDATIVTALAAAIAGTDAPAAIAKEITGVTREGEKCTTFAACMVLVKDHKNIDYDGPSGPLEFTNPGEPSSATYIIGETQADGTVKALKSVHIGPR